MPNNAVSYSMSDDGFDLRGANGAEDVGGVGDRPKIKVVVAGKPMVFESRSGELPSWVVNAATDLDRIGRYREGWDSYRAKTVPWRTLFYAMDLLLKVMDDDTPPPRVEATNAGGVELLWSRDGKELEIGIDRPFGVSAYYLDPSRDIESEEPIGIEHQRLKEFLLELRR